MRERRRDMYSEQEMDRERGSSQAQTKETRAKTSRTGGLFTPGGPGGPGRPKAVDNRDYIAALKAGFPPERITELLNTAIDIAIASHSWRGVVAAAEFAAAYSLGKPKQTVESMAGDNLAEMLAGIDTSAPLLPVRPAATSATSAPED
jgi:hypothetical protein